MSTSEFQNAVSTAWDCHAWARTLATVASARRGTTSPPREPRNRAFYAKGWGVARVAVATTTDIAAVAAVAGANHEFGHVATGAVALGALWVAGVETAIGRDGVKDFRAVDKIDRKTKPMVLTNLARCGFPKNPDSWAGLPEGEWNYLVTTCVENADSSRADFRSAVGELTKRRVGNTPTVFEQIARGGESSEGKALLMLVEVVAVGLEPSSPSRSLTMATPSL